MIERNYDVLSLDDLKHEDKFERYKYLSSIEKLIFSEKDDNFVLQISGQFGSGKTFFVNLLKKHLEQKGYKTLYYNAWQHDYAQDAFISFCSIFIRHFETSPNSAGFKAAAQKLVVNNIPAMLKYCLGAFVGKYTGIDTDKLIDAACDFAQDVDDHSQQVQKLCNDVLDIELNRENVISEFRHALSQLVDTQRKEFPLVVFIDDLDRCKADFAVRLLDYIKHLFNIKGITFILAVDDEQLKSTIQQFYGAKNAAGYLKRIVDFEFYLPLGDYKNYIRSLIREYDFMMFAENDFLVNLLNNLGFIFDLSLRDFRRIFEQVHKVMCGWTLYKHAPYVYFVAYIMRAYFDKYKREIALLKTEEGGRLSDSQKLAHFFNYKFANDRHYTNSLRYDTPLTANRGEDYNLQEVIVCMVEIPDATRRNPCYRLFPSHLLQTNNYDPYRQKTIYEKVWEEMMKILSDEF